MRAVLKLFATAMIVLSVLQVSAAVQQIYDLRRSAAAMDASLRPISPTYCIEKCDDPIGINSDDSCEHP